MATDVPLPPDRDHGPGIFRRRVTLVPGAKSIDAHLIDDFHEMRCVVRHDGEVVTDVHGEMMRWPYTTCPGAAVPLRELIGLPLALTRGELYADGRARRNCTHLFDLAALAMRHALGPSRSFDVVAPDQRDGEGVIEIACDGAMLLRLGVRDDLIVAPAPYAGRRFFRGFSKWAAETFDGLDLDAALLAQMGAFLSRGRQEPAGSDAARLRNAPERIGVCFTYSEPQFWIAEPMPGSQRDFTDGLPESDALGSQF